MGMRRPELNGGEEGAKAARGRGVASAAAGRTTGMRMRMRRCIAALVVAAASVAHGFTPSVAPKLLHIGANRRSAPVALREPVPPPPPGAPSAFDTFKRWTSVQLTADGTSIACLCLITGKTPIDLYNEQAVLLWVLLGPALITFGAVWARITQTDADAKYGDDDFFIKKLGGKPGVQSLRYTISNALRF